MKITEVPKRTETKYCAKSTRKASGVGWDYLESLIGEGEICDETFLTGKANIIKI